MSGVLWTSLMNGVLNLCILSFLKIQTEHPELSAQEQSVKIHELQALFEGDDGIMASEGIPAVLMEQLGVKLKLEVKPRFTMASFCGKTSAEQSDNVTPNVKKIVREFFVLPIKYRDANEKIHKSLLRAKALSYFHCYPNSPIVQALCLAVCKKTSGINISAKHRGVVGYNDYIDAGEKDMKDRFRSVLRMGGKATTNELFREPTMIDRHHMEELYGISVEDQCAIESSLLQWGDGVLDSTYIPWRRYMDKDEIFYTNNFICETEPLLKRHYLSLNDIFSKVSNVDESVSRIEASIVVGKEFDHARVKATSFLDYHDGGERLAHFKKL